MLLGTHFGSRMQGHMREQYLSPSGKQGPHCFANEVQANSPLKQSVDEIPTLSVQKQPPRPDEEWTAYHTLFKRCNVVRWKHK